MLFGWLYRRWYRSLLPIIIGGLGFVAASDPLFDELKGVESFVAFARAVTFGLLGACLTVSTSVVCSMQMSAVVRAAFVVILWRLAILAHHSDDWVENSLLPESAFFVVGALIAELLRIATPQRLLTGPTSRGLGVPNRSGDWILVASILTYAVALILSRNEVNAAEYLRRTFILCAVFTLTGFATSVITRTRFQHQRGWLFHLIAVTAGAVILRLVLPVIQPFEDAADWHWTDRIGFVVIASLSWYVAQYWLARRLADLGWRFKPRREALKLQENGEIDFVATDRQNRHIASQGWTSIAGVFLLTAVSAMLASLLAGFPIAGINNKDTAFVLTMMANTIRMFLAMAGLGLISIVTVSVVRGFFQQSLIAVLCFASVGISWTAIAQTEQQDDIQDALVWISLAMPAVLCIRRMKLLCDRFTRFEVGVSRIEKQPLMIRSIMLLTFLTGVQILIVQAIHWDSNLVIAVLCISTLSILLTFFTVRRHLGNKTWINFLCVSMPTVSLIGGFGALAAYNNQHVPLALLVGSIWFACFYGAVWLSISWLQHIGWKPLPTSSSSSARQPAGNIDVAP